MDTTEQRVALLEAPENSALIGRRNPRPRVLHAHAQKSVRAGNRHINTAVRGELDGIAEQIMQHLGKPHVIDKDEFRNIPDEHEIDKNTFFPRSRLVDLHTKLER